MTVVYIFGNACIIGFLVKHFKNNMHELAAFNFDAESLLNFLLLGYRVYVL